MADSDFDDDLLALAEGTSKRKSSNKNSKPNKRRRPADSDDGSASDMDMSQSDSDAPAASSPRAGKRGGRVKSAAQVDSSDEDSEYDDGGVRPTADNPYPFEGIYKDAADKRYVMGLSEIEREDVISTRKDEMTERDLRKQVAVMANKSGGRAAADSDDEDEDDDEEYGARGTRSRKTTGATKSKAEGLEKLKRSRAEKGKKKEKKDDSDDDYEEGGKSRRRRDSSDDPYASDADSEEDDSRAKKSSSKGKKKAEPAGPGELQEVVVTRTKLAELCPAPWFKEWVVGAFVRYSVGLDDYQQPKYLLCEVVDIAKRPDKSYRFENVTTDIHLELQHGKSVRHFSMDAVSNSPFTPREYARLQQMCQVDDVPFPSPKDVAKLKDQLSKRSTYTLTEEDLAQQLAQKGRKKTGAAHKAQLRMERDQAVASNDSARVAEIDELLAEIDRAGVSDKKPTAEMLNERNKLANREEVRRAEARGQEERRKQQEALARGDLSVKVDASARVKTVPKMNYESRPHTPNPGTPGGSGRATPSNLGPGGAGPTTAGARAAKGGKIESTVASRVQLDVDLDF